MLQVLRNVPCILDMEKDCAEVSDSS